ncbi:MAG: DinB family protein [candidate division Zixibacteria bacterium]|nr:DinB family protein [candidate division Zixibacteria bacterium]
MDATCKEMVWRQLGAAIDTLENCITECPDERWDDRARRVKYWYDVFHALFWLDYYMSDDHDSFHPPEPFGLEEMDPAGIIPARAYTKEELLTYLNFGREKARARIESMTVEKASEVYKFRKADVRLDELFLYIMRHIQHHAGQLNLILRDEYDQGSRWVFQAK